MNIYKKDYGPFRRMKYNPELRWALSKMYEHHLIFSSRVNMRLWILRKGFATLK